MIIPSRRVCDWCGCDLVGAYTQITVPLPVSLQRELEAYEEERRQGRVKTSPFSGMFPTVVPNACTLEQCVVCTGAGILSDVMVKIRDLVRATIDARIAAARRAASAIEEWEPEPFEKRSES